MPDDVAARVAALGGSRESLVEFRDEYFDTQSLDLTTDDVWLRRRDGAWELKVPHGDQRRASGGETTAFRELVDVGEIAAALAEREVEFPGGVAPFAAFSTKRETFALGGVRVDVDAASYGHAVLELEVMTDGSAAAVAAARAAIAAAARDLGCAPLPADAGGKLETYLKRYCPAHARAIGLLPR